MLLPPTVLLQVPSLPLWMWSSFGFLKGELHSSELLVVKALGDPDTGLQIL